MASPCQHCGSTEGPDHLCSGSSLALVGQVLDGRYRIESVLGQGGMGMVFRATQTSVQRPVAVKTLNPALAAAPTFFERFKREAELASRLRHPNIITIYDFGRAADGTCYYVMELLEGESLKELVKRQGPMSLGRAVALIEQATRGLAHAHVENCVHRDLKPHNIMVQQLDGKDFVKVLDFGLVKAMEQEEEEQLTSTGQVLGTPQYMPPEQAGGEVVDRRSDLYSMAGVLYFCLTGNSPYGANTVRKALTAALTQKPPTVGARRQGAPVPAALDAFIQKALSQEKEDRHQTAEEFIEAMPDAVADCTPEELDALPLAPPGTQPGTSSRPSAASHRRSPSQSGVRGKGSGSAVGPRSGSAPSGVIVARSTTGQVSAVRSRVAADAPSQPSQRSQRASAVVPPPVDPGETTSPGGNISVKKVALAVVALVLLVAGGAVMALRSGSPPAATTSSQQVQAPTGQPAGNPAQPVQAASPTPTEAPAQSEKVAVEVRSTPDGAAIFNKEGTQIGTAGSSTLLLSRNEVHTLVFRLPDHKEKERTLDFSTLAGAETLVEVTLEPVRKPQPAVRPSRPTNKPPPGNSGPDISVFD